jgi:oligopeptide/dipeptide ABC transporter ATP-binding protein
MVPAPLDWPAGCRFAGRCELAQPECSAGRPALTALEEEHSVACILVEQAS